MSIATDILTTLKAIQRYSTGQNSQKLTEETQKLTHYLTALNSLPEAERTTAFTHLQKHLQDVNILGASLTAQQNALKDKIIKIRQQATAQKGYGQHMK